MKDRSRRAVIGGAFIVVVLIAGVAGTAFGSPGAEKPAAGQVSLTYWVAPESNVTANAKTYNEVPFYQELERRTGVKVTYMHPPAGQEAEQFSLMIASNDLPDIIETGWSDYPGGPLKAISDGVILDHTSLIKKNAPNLSKYLAANPSTDKLVKTDSGQYYTFPLILGDDLLLVFYGLQVRQDWLTDLGLPVPQTIDDWTNVLSAFKTRKGAAYPFTISGGANSFWRDPIVDAYHIRWDFYMDNGKVFYGPIMPGAKQYMATLAKWFSGGLLDNDFAAQDGATLDAKVTSGKAGAWPGYMGSTMGRYIQLMASKDPAFKIVGAPYPVLTRGERPFTGQRENAFGGYGASITTKAKDPAAAARFLDYSYGDQGHMLNNFGVEGTSYTMVNGYPTYTDIVKKNPNGLTFSQALVRWARAGYGGPFVEDRRYFEQYVQLPEQVKAVQAWSNTDAAQHRLPTLTLTSAESDRTAAIMTPVTTFRDEWFLKFVMNQTPLDQFDSYVAEIKKMGIDEAIAIQQAALDRYNKR